MSIALDTNILVYLEGAQNDDRHSVALDIVRRIPAERIVIPVQVIGELYRVLVGKQHMNSENVRELISILQIAYNIVGTTPETMQLAVELAVGHRFSIWDAIVLSTAAVAGCRALLTEDMHHGFNWNGVTVVDPFATPAHPLLGVLQRG